MSDHILRAISQDGNVRAFAIDSRELVEYARERHELSPVMCAALGRLLSAAAMMGTMMKGDDDILTVSIKGTGPGGNITVTADSKGHVKGFAGNPAVFIPLKENGKLDVGGAVGPGFLQVIKDVGLKDPYIGQTELVNGEIAEDLTYYFAASEQVPSCVGLGVLVDTDGSIRQAGGFIIQLMPGADDETIDLLEKNITSFGSVTAHLDSGDTIQEILADVLKGIPFEVTDDIPAAFKCDCSRERVKKALIAVGRDEIKDMIREGKPVELRCSFCNSAYEFGIDELNEIL